MYVDIKFHIRTFFIGKSRTGYKFPQFPQAKREERERERGRVKRRILLFTLENSGF